MCKLQCVEVHTLLKKSRLDLVIFLCPIKVFVDLHPKNDQPCPTMIFFNKVQISTHCNLHIFFSNSITILTVFSYLYRPMSSSYILM